jgi:hypothetical protein
MFGCGGVQPGAKETVKRSGRTASLHMAQFCHAQLESQTILMLQKVSRHDFRVVAGTFRHHHNGMPFAPLISISQLHSHRASVRFRLRYIAFLIKLNRTGVPGIIERLEAKRCRQHAEWGIASTMPRLCHELGVHPIYDFTDPFLLPSGTEKFPPNH